MFFLIVAAVAGVSVLLYSLYQRHIPVHGVPYIDIENAGMNNDAVVLDVRDYSDATKHPVEGVVQLPYAYLNRHAGEIQKRKVLVIVSDRMLLNLTVRYLRRKGFTIMGYYIRYG
ncbi:sulfurtransferase [Paenibacillus abyssi]|nr:sulfurtransferase [Paenibacillus abyssi]